MEQTKPDPVPAGSQRKRRAKLFRVLVLGGAVLAAATVSFLHGGIGSPRGDQDDGGTQGW